MPQQSPNPGASLTGENLRAERPERDERPTERPFALLARFSAVVRHLRHQADSKGIRGEHDLSPRQLMMLSHVVMLAPVSVSDLAQQMQISLATASQMLTGLAQAGFVERREDPADHRRTLITLSPHGTAAAEKLREAMLPLDEAISVVGDESFAHLLSTLDAIVARLSELEETDGADKDC